MYIPEAHNEVEKQSHYALLLARNLMLHVLCFSGKKPREEKTQTGMKLPPPSFVVVMFSLMGNVSATSQSENNHPGN